MSARTAGAAVAPPRPTVASALIVALALAVAVDLVSLLAGAELGHRIAKPLLMPLLATYIAAQCLLTAGALKAEYGERRTTD
ncbi:hypothetical protein ACFVZW_27750 [Streptomyces sp. NPDC059567]|uniref:hypothetical protein n=1 Tax=Streptomyces sp. NPDC059567 TaxID=3346867 RepID=UPI00367F7C93